MPLPSPLPLDDFERAIQADPQVLGMLYFGSLGRGSATRFSDLDILHRSNVHVIGLVVGAWSVWQPSL